jgi:hypothetical protein
LNINRCGDYREEETALILLGFQIHLSTAVETLKLNPKRNSRGLSDSTAALEVIYNPRTNNLVYLVVNSRPILIKRTICR